MLSMPKQFYWHTSQDQLFDLDRYVYTRMYIAHGAYAIWSTILIGLKSRLRSSPSAFRTESNNIWLLTCVSS